MTVCGQCGVLYDSMVPTGVRVEEGKSDVDSMVSTDSTPFKPWRPSSDVGAEKADNFDGTREMKALMGISLLHTGRQ